MIHKHKKNNIMPANPVGPTEFSIPQILNQTTDLDIVRDETIVSFSRVGQTQIRISVSFLFTPETIGQNPTNNEPHSVIDFVNGDVFVSGAPFKLTTSLDSKDRAVFNFSTEDLTVVSRKVSFGV